MSKNSDNSDVFKESVPYSDIKPEEAETPINSQDLPTSFANVYLIDQIAGPSNRSANEDMILIDTSEEECMEIGDEISKEDLSQELHQSKVMPRKSYSIRFKIKVLNYNKNDNVYKTSQNFIIIINKYLFFN